MGHKHDYWEGWRGYIIPKLGWIAQLLEDVTGERYYVEAETHNNQFVGRVPMNEEEFEKELHDMGFERNPLAAWKHLESDPSNHEEGSFRKIGWDDYPEMQLHTILYDSDPIDSAPDGYTFVYAHWEYRWDTHPWKHYRGGGKYSGPEGVRRMKRLLDDHGIQHEPIRP